MVCIVVLLLLLLLLSLLLLLDFYFEGYFLRDREVLVVAGRCDANLDLVCALLQALLHCDLPCLLIYCDLLGELLLNNADFLISHLALGLCDCYSLLAGDLDGFLLKPGSLDRDFLCLYFQRAPSNEYRRMMLYMCVRT